MKNLFDLTIEEKKELAEKHDFTPANFAKVEETTSTTTTTINPQ
jgi:hypothetical protein